MSLSKLAVQIRVDHKWRDQSSASGRAEQADQRGVRRADWRVTE